MTTKTYKILYAEDVPHCGIKKIEAADDNDAIERAKAFWHERPEDRPTDDPDWSSTVCHRIVNILDEDGDDVAGDIALDNCVLRFGGPAERRRCEAAADLICALKTVRADFEMLQSGTWDGSAAGCEAAIERIDTALRKAGEVPA